MFSGLWERRMIAAAERRVAELRSLHPYASPPELADRLIRRKAGGAAIAGSLTALPAVIPGIGTVIAVLIGTFADLTVLGRLLRSLVYELAIVYGRNPREKDIQKEIAWVFATAAGVEAAGKHVAGRAARGLGHLASSAGQRSILRLGFQAGQRTLLFRLLPFVGVALVGGINYFFALSVGRKMLNGFGSDKDSPTWGPTINAEYTVEG